MHRDVGPTVEHGLLDLLDEDALAADGVQRHVLAAVAGGLDEHELDRRAGRVASTALGDGLGLRRASGAPPRRAQRGGHGRQEVEQVAHRGGVALALRRAGVVASRTDGSCSSLATIAWVSASTASRSASSRSARRPANRASSPHRTDSACSCSRPTSGAAWRAVDLDAEPLDLLGDDRPHELGLGGALGEAAVGPVAQVVEIEQRDAGQPGDRRSTARGTAMSTISSGRAGSALRCDESRG